jgi:hypothetical protein
MNAAHGILAVDFGLAAQAVEIDRLQHGMPKILKKR